MDDREAAYEKQRVYGAGSPYGGASGRLADAEVGYVSNADGTAEDIRAEPPGQLWRRKLYELAGQEQARSHSLYRLAEEARALAEKFRQLASI